MAQLDDNVKLQVTFGDGQGSFDGTTPFDYSALQLLANIDDNNQLEVYWEVNSVFTAAPGDPNREELVLTSVSAAVREAIRLVPNTFWTADTATHSLTIQDLSDQQNNTAYGSYWFPPNATITSVQPVQIRRSTEVDSRIVSFEPGTRLTSENLNLANTQMFNAIQEITRYGLGGSGSVGGTINLEDSSITDLGDVNINPQLPLSGYLEWDGVTKQVTIQNVATGNFVPITNDVTNTIGQVLYLNDDTTNAGYIWKRLAASDVVRKTGGVTLDDYFTNSVDAPIAALQSSFTFLSTEFNKLGFANDEFTFTDGTTDFAINMAGDITTAGDVTANDVIVDGVSVKDHIAADVPYWIAVDSGSTINNLASTSHERVLGDDGQFNYDPAQDLTGSDTDDWNSSTGIWTAPRAMVIRCDARGNLVRTIDPDDSNRHRTYSGDLKIYHNGAAFGKTWKHRVDALYGVVQDGPGTNDGYINNDVIGGRDDSGLVYAILEVAAGDEIKFQIERNDISNDLTGAWNDSRAPIGVPSEFKYTGAYCSITEIR